MEKRKRKIIGYTTGVYDLFHIGHLNIIKRAKENCDYLIVGVSVDDLVESYKHKRPIIPFEERIEIIRALKYVDEAVPQTSMDKYEAWTRLHYDRIFHGDDWKGSAMYNTVEEKLRSAGVEVVYFPYTEGTSSTLLTEILYQSLMEKR
ncbi:MAG: adenylyltransferase/cytidyltransferase family protein [Oscillospiraceae bacterium]|nr:adenylyltransferase/cytidyltransferase family protein [Oscillospiraceae bacterium]